MNGLPSSIALSLFVYGVLVGCTGASVPPAASAPSSQAASEDASAPRRPSDHQQPWVLTRADSIAISWSPVRREIVAWSPEGVPRWWFTLPSGDSLVAQPAVAANSSLYLRGAQRLYAFDHAGEMLWSHDLGAPTSPRSVGRPVPLADSGVLLAMTNGRVSAWSPTGDEMWSFDLPNGGMLVDSPRLSPNGMIWLVTETNLMALSPAGKEVISRTLQRPSADDPVEP